jgi:MFS family permease
MCCNCVDYLSVYSSTISVRFMGNRASNRFCNTYNSRKIAFTICTIHIASTSLILGTNFILLISNDIKLIYGAAILFASGNGFMWPSIMSILSKRAGTVYQGAVQAYPDVASSFASLASIIGLTTGGLLYNLIGGTTFLISTVVIFIVFILSFRLLRLH